ncbi:carbohydrate kinase family protein [Halovenus sp. WSH3]|uniref:Carbohydrate kinase family protein n=1 Tax=Halovenus carboxidivorans TaxID=2692199 RepID=A0A6B0TBN3_9EURY|nr:PfkB family carbohydrate kinase [Halovenus carboxidivorans]MXR52641.1 carbohydrate kinase family protein [Halovenus carboxidivorans]
MSRVVCAGHVNWDVTLHVDDLPDPDGEAAITHQSQAGGGSASNTATALAGLGIDVSLLGSVGDDQYATLARDELDSVGVDCSALKSVSGETTVKYIVVDEDGEVFVFANEGVNEAYDADDLAEETLAAADRLHLTSQDPSTAADLAKRARKRSIPVSFDPGRRLDTRAYDDLIREVDLLFLNEREADAVESLLETREFPTVIKRGNGGATVRSPDGRITHEGFDVDASDTAGAGDAFAAGYLASVLRGRSVRDALADANACGALAVQSPGARVDLSLSAVERYRRDH